jgi:putative phosphoesterase
MRQWSRTPTNRVGLLLSAKFVATDQAIGHAASMVNQVAVLSDIHGVLPVLDAVLAEPDVSGADLIVVTGDHAAGPQPVAVLDRLTGLGERVLVVRGNADRELVALARGEPAEFPDVSPWAAAQLTEAHLDLLAGLPHPVTIQIDGFGAVVFCHGTPRDDNEVVLVDTRLERWADVFAELPPAVQTVVCGHTHMPFVRLVDRRLVINPGSIGMPYGRAGGNWALLRDGAVTLRRTPIDVDRAVARVVAESDYPDRQAWADEYLRATHSDAEALTAFGPRDGRPPRRSHARLGLPKTR